jgi:RNA polymerase sigma-70 factor (ECF subfamily)
MPAVPHLRVVQGGEAPEAPFALSGDDVLPESDRALFERFAPYVARIALRLIGREAEVDDLVQEVFLAAFRQRHQVREPAAFRGWLATVTVRKARRHLQRRRWKSLVGIDTAGYAPELRDTGVSPEQKALLARVYEALDRLPVDHRLAWTLRHVEGERLERVAERCGCSLATAKRRIASAHARIRVELSDG